MAEDHSAAVCPRPAAVARIEDLRHGDLIKVDCAACLHVALLTPEFVRRLGLSPQTKVLDLKERVRGCGGAAVDKAGGTEDERAGAD